MRSDLAGAIAVGALCVTLAVIAVIRPEVPIDTTLLVRGAYDLPDCIGGVADACDEIGAWPLLQYLLALPLGLLGFSEQVAVKTLAAASAIAFALTIVIVARTLRRFGIALAATLVLLFVTGPMLWYAASTFGESLTAAALALAVSAALARRRAWVLALAVVLAALTKETAPPFVALLVAAAVLVAEPRERWRARFGAIVIGAGGAFGLAGAFNLLRYGSVLNEYYLNPDFRVPGVLRDLDFGLAMWLSPNAGVLFFWPLAFALLLACGVVAVRRSRRTASSMGLVLIALTGLTLGFSNLIAPFGWVAWGPRYLLPWIVPALLVAMAAVPDVPARIVSWLTAGGTRAAMLALAALVQAAPHLGALADRPAHARLFGTVDEGCNRIPVLFEVPMPFFLDCIHHYAWTKWPGPLRHGLSGLDEPLAPLLVGVCAAAVAALVWHMRRDRPQQLLPVDAHASPLAEEVRPIAL